MNAGQYDRGRPGFVINYSYTARPGSATEKCFWELLKDSIPFAIPGTLL